jgi:alpha-beta hydrolase superfamily lysophospholipase
MDFIGFDLRGHGKSEGSRGHVNKLNLFLNDVEVLLAHIDKTYSNLPVVLYGHSMGGNIAMNYLLRRDKNNISCGLITSPWLKLAIEPTLVQHILAKVGDKLLPSLTQPNGLNVEDISSVKEVQEWYANDPMNHDRISGRLFAEINRAGLWALDHAGALSVPVLIAHGTADNITAPAASLHFAAHSERATLKLWEGLRHETHNEYNQNEVLDFYVDWVQKSCSRTG